MEVRELNDRFKECQTRAWHANECHFMTFTHSKVMSFLKGPIYFILIIQVCTFATNYRVYYDPEQLFKTW